MALGGGLDRGLNGGLDVALNGELDGALDITLLYIKKHKSYKLPIKYRAHR